MAKFNLLGKGNTMTTNEKEQHTHRVKVMAGILFMQAIPHIC